jgi:hypothetical protein
MWTHDPTRFHDYPAASKVTERVEVGGLSGNPPIWRGVVVPHAKSQARRVQNKCPPSRLRQVDPICHCRVTCSRPFTLAR